MELLCEYYGVRTSISWYLKKEKIIHYCSHGLQHFNHRNLDLAFWGTKWECVT